MVIFALHTCPQSREVQSMKCCPTPNFFLCPLRSISQGEPVNKFSKGYSCGNASHEIIIILLK